MIKFLVGSLKPADWSRMNFAATVFDTFDEAVEHAKTIRALFDLEQGIYRRENGATGLHDPDDVLMARITAEVTYTVEMVEP